MLMKILCLTLVSCVFAQVPDSRCPSGPTREVIVLPHETDCTRFYVCNFGNRIPMVCPVGHEFDTRNMECVRAGHALCASSTTTQTIATTTQTIATTTPATLPTTIDVPTAPIDTSTTIPGEVPTVPTASVNVPTIPIVVPTLPNAP